MDDEDVSDRKKGGWVISLALVVVVGVFLLFALNSSGGVTGTSIYNDNKIDEKHSEGIDNVKKFSLVTKDSGIEPTEIEIEQNETIIIKLSAKGEGQGIEIPAYGVDEPSLEDKIKEIRFKVDKKGEFEYGCGSYCGKSRGEMEGSLVVE